MDSIHSVKGTYSEIYMQSGRYSQWKIQTVKDTHSKEYIW